MAELVRDIQVETTTDSQRAIDGQAAGDEEAARATPAEAFDGFSQSADGHTLAYENPQGSERSGLLERLAELESDEAAPPVDESLAEPETVRAEDSTPEGSKTVRQMAEEQAARHAAEFQEEQHRLAMTREFGGQWIQEGYAQFNQRVDELTKAIPDFRKTMAENTPLIEAIEKRPAIAEVINFVKGGPDVAYWLTQHPDQAQRLMQLPDNVAVAQVGQWAAQLYSPPIARRTSNAPAPINPVRGSATKSSVPLDQADYQTYKRVRDQQQKSRYRR